MGKAAQKKKATRTNKAAAEAATACQAELDAVLKRHGFAIAREVNIDPMLEALIPTIRSRLSFQISLRSVRGNGRA